MWMTRHECPIAKGGIEVETLVSYIHLGSRSRTDRAFGGAFPSIAAAFV